ncbi:cupin domain-containing protein [Micromonospora sp. KC606]|uniref:cupin domain-containing protein n=1 Tax=Micromonospora sp. KC606 TaxID=2530379 RepID=UPI00140487C8|nr:cupin domain-containing protein [Micromonospora sp. KC606]
MIEKVTIDADSAVEEFGMRCQRLIPQAIGPQEPPLGAMACFLEAGRDSAPDCHDQDELMVVIAGTGAVTLAGERTPIGPGDLVFLPRNREHVVHSAAGTRLSWLSVYWPLYEPVPGATA